MAHRDDREPPGEFDIIARYFRPLAKQHAGAYNLEDDCASIEIPANEELIVSCDTLVAGVHFFPDDPPDSIACKALGVNLSDIYAKGAVPHSYLLSFSSPGAMNANWLETFSAGLARMQKQYGLSLAGGDTVSTKWPLTLSITIMGTTPKGAMVPRGGAAAGDLVYVTGAIGDSFLGLQCALDPDFASGLTETHANYLKDRYLHPQPRAEYAELVRDYASACMDISDGLAADFTKMCKASNAGGVINLETVPLSEAATTAIKKSRFDITDLVSGGDDYELLIAVPQSAQTEFETAAARTGVSLTRIGEIKQELGVKLKQNGKTLQLSRSGYNHFS